MRGPGGGVDERRHEQVTAQVAEEDRSGRGYPDRTTELLRRAEQPGRTAGRLRRDGREDHVHQRGRRPYRPST